VLGEVDKLFKVLARAASEQLGNLSSNPRNASSMHTSMASVGGGVNAEKERIYQFVSAALRFAIQHNSKHRNLDVDSVEQVSQHTHSIKNQSSTASSVSLYQCCAYGCV
jgi:hypothetical protein